MTVRHFDSAGCGRCSAATRLVVTAHLDREAAVGGYVAEAEVAQVLDAGRAALAALLGVDAGPDDVAFVPSASAALGQLLRAWPLAPSARVAVAPSEWGPNVTAFRDAGLQVEPLPVDPYGGVDLPALERVLERNPPDLVHLTAVAAHRPLVQPVADVAGQCDAAGVPLWVDAAQALGHVDLTGSAPDAAYATGRTWLSGPRGVGVLAVDPDWADVLRVPESIRHTAPNASPVRRLEPTEAFVAGRVGLCAAVEQHLGAGPGRVHQGLADVGRRTRHALATVPGWQVVPPIGGDVAITALWPTGAVDAVTTRTRLLVEHGILAGACLPAAAPADVRAPLLRISPQLDVTDDDLPALVHALAHPGRPTTT